MSVSRYEVILLRAMEVESAHFRSCLRTRAYAESEPGEPESARRFRRDGEEASVAAAAIGAAARFVREHASLADERLKRLAAHAERLVGLAPPELHLLFTLHFIDGYPLTVYATATDMDLAAAADDYRNLVQALADAGTDWVAVLQGAAPNAKEPR
jgi:hypothetical protein